MLLVGWLEGHLACKKTERWGAGVVICLERGADLHMAQRIPLPITVSCFSKIQIGFTFLVPAPRVVPDKGLLNVCALYFNNNTSYLFQRISIMLQRFNSVLLHGTLPVDLPDL